MASRLEAAYHTMEQRITQATAELRSRKEDAERANLAKSRFLAAASHDLRQPMHALVLFISELSSRSHPPETRRLVRQIAASAEAMENLLDSLLDISKLDAGVLQPEIRAFPLQRSSTGCPPTSVRSPTSVACACGSMPPTRGR